MKNIGEENHDNSKITSCSSYNNIGSVMSVYRLNKKWVIVICRGFVETINGFVYSESGSTKPSSDILKS
jgi:hypothetical protein